MILSSDIFWFNVPTIGTQDTIFSLFPRVAAWYKTIHPTVR